MVVADDMLTEQVLRYRAIVAEINARERERDALEFAIKREMGDAAVLAIGVDQKPAFTWKTEERAQLDYDKLKNEYPTVYKACSGKRSSRVFRYKNPGMEGVIS
jgi:predicted phage-related endonuclease